VWPGIDVVCFFDDRYPPALSRISDPPPVLFARGNLDLLVEERLLAVVGTRAPTVFGETAARAITTKAAEDRWGTSMDWRSALIRLRTRSRSRSRAPAIAILGNGLERVYPKANASPAQRILERRRLLLSELWLGAPPLPRNLIACDRLQSGLASAVSSRRRA
jgi:DNA processing protein